MLELEKRKSEVVPLGLETPNNLISVDTENVTPLVQDINTKINSVLNPSKSDGAFSSFDVSRFGEDFEGNQNLPTDDGEAITSPKLDVAINHGEANVEIKEVDKNITVKKEVLKK